MRNFYDEIIRTPCTATGVLIPQTTDR